MPYLLCVSHIGMYMSCMQIMGTIRTATFSGTLVIFIIVCFRYAWYIKRSLGKKNTSLKKNEEILIH